MVDFKPSFQLPLVVGLVICTPILSFRSQYPTPRIWFLIPHRSTFVSSTPPIKPRLKYPTYWISFFIPLCSILVFNTPILDFGFWYPMCDFRFVKWYDPCSNEYVYYIIQKIVKFLSEMSVFCQNLWYNVYSDISKGRYSCAWLWVLFLDYHFLLSYSW